MPQVSLWLKDSDCLHRYFSMLITRCSSRLCWFRDFVLAAVELNAAVFLELSALPKAHTLLSDREIVLEFVQGSGGLAAAFDLRRDPDFVRRVVAWDKSLLEISPLPANRMLEEAMAIRMLRKLVSALPFRNSGLPRVPPDVVRTVRAFAC